MKWLHCSAGWWIGMVAFGAIAAADVSAQRGRNSLRNTKAMCALFEAAVAKANASTFEIEHEEDVVAFATAVSKTEVLTKASELPDGELTLSFGDRSLPLTRVAKNRADDLALLRVDEELLTPVDWSDAIPSRGAFVASPDGDGAPMAFGILSAQPYSHSRNRGYLGVQLDREAEGVKLQSITDNSAAADVGLEAGDVILAVDGESIASSAQLVRQLQRRKPGTKIVLEVQRGDEKMELAPVLGSNRQGRRSDQEPIWGPLSAVRAGFDLILQHDTVLRPAQCGGPLVDLEGRVIGINIARAGRVECLALPSSTVRATLATMRSK